MVMQPDIAVLDCVVASDADFPSQPFGGRHSRLSLVTFEVEEDLERAEPDSFVLSGTKPSPQEERQVQTSAMKNSVTHRVSQVGS